MSSWYEELEKAKKRKTQNNLSMRGAASGGNGFGSASNTRANLKKNLPPSYPKSTVSVQKSYNSRPSYSPTSNSLLQKKATSVFTKTPTYGNKTKPNTVGEQLRKNAQSQSGSSVAKHTAGYMNYAKASTNYGNVPKQTSRYSNTQKLQAFSQAPKKTAGNYYNQAIKPSVTKSVNAPSKTKNLNFGSSVDLWRDPKNSADNIFGLEKWEDLWNAKPENTAEARVAKLNQKNILAAQKKRSENKILSRILPDLMSVWTPPSQTQAKKNADFSQLSLNKPETKKPANTGTGGQPLIGPLPYHPARIKEEWTYGVNGLSRLKPGQSPAVTMVNPNKYAYLRYSHDPKQRQKQFEQEYKKQSPDKNPMQAESLGNFIGRSEAAYQQDEKAYLRELAQFEYGKYGLDDYLKINRPFTEAEKEQARIFMKKFDAQTSSEFRKYAGNRDGMGAKPMPESVRILQKKREALGAKVSRGDGAFYGLMNALTFGAARNKENRSNAQYLEQYATQTTPLTPDQQAHQQIFRSYGGKSSFDVAKENQAGPYFVGTALGEVGKYYVGAKLGSAAPGMSGVQKASTKLSKLTKGAISENTFRNLIAGRVAEMPFDAAAIGADAQSWDDFAKRFAVSQLQGLAFDGMNQIMDSVQGRFAKNPFAQNMNSSNLQEMAAYSKLKENKRFADNTHISPNAKESITRKNVSKSKPRPYIESGARPSYRKGIENTVWNGAKINETVRDPNTRDIINWEEGTSRKGVWDMGHIPTEKYSEKHAQYEKGEITLEEFRDWYNDPKNYRPELPKNNRSHKFE